MGRSNTAYSIFALLIFVSLLLLPGCLGMKRGPEKPKATLAFRLALKAKEFNRGIITAKGLGWITIEQNFKIEKYRIAWAVACPDKMRITLLSLGHPVETIIADGKRVTFISHTGRHEPHIIKAANPSLANFIHISLRAKDIIKMLAGQMPIIEFDTARINPLDSLDGTPLVLSRSWRGDVGRILMDRNEKPIKYQPMDFQGRSSYIFTAGKFKQIDSFEIPMEITIKDQRGGRVLLTITRFFQNISLKDDIFSLTESG